MLVNHYFQIREAHNHNHNHHAHAHEGTTHGIVQVMTEKLFWVYENTFVRWVQRLYLAWKWHFLDPPDVCAALTGSPASFWQQHLPECQDRISRDFTAWVVYAECFILVLLYMRCCGCWRGRY